MENQNREYVLYTYKYIWQVKDGEKLCIKYITDTMQSHENFMEKLRSEMSIVKACREYISEYDVRFVSVVENIKGGAENEKVQN